MITVSFEKIIQSNIFHYLLFSLILKPTSLLSLPLLSSPLSCPLSPTSSLPSPLPCPLLGCATHNGYGVWGQLVEIIFSTNRRYFHLPLSSSLLRHTFSSSLSLFSSINFWIMDKNKSDCCHLQQHMMISIPPSLFLFCTVFLSLSFYTLCHVTLSHHSSISIFPTQHSPLLGWTHQLNFGRQLVESIMCTVTAILCVRAHPLKCIWQ